MTVPPMAKALETAKSFGVLDAKTGEAQLTTTWAQLQMAADAGHAGAHERRDRMGSWEGAAARAALSPRRLLTARLPVLSEAAARVLAARRDAWSDDRARARQTQAARR